MVNAAWILSVTCLWPFTCFSDKEIAEGKRYIRRFIINEADPYKAYMEYCQRILLLARLAVQDTCHDTPQHGFFHLHNNKGFVQTRDLFKQLQQQRLLFLLYMQELKALPAAILNISEEPGLENFNSWLDWFVNHLAFSECKLLHRWLAKTGINCNNHLKSDAT